MTPSFTFTGQSGQTYQFSSHLPDVQWNSIGGCYAFAVQTPNALGAVVARVLYIGQTDSFQRRMKKHRGDTWAVAARAGGHTILAFVATNEAARLTTEQNLIPVYQPRLNTQHVQ